MQAGSRNCQRRIGGLWLGSGSGAATAAWVGADVHTLNAFTKVIEAIEVAVDPSLETGVAGLINHIPFGAVVHKERLGEDGRHVGATGNHSPAVLLDAAVGTSELLYKCCLHLIGEVARVASGPIIPSFRAVCAAIEGIEVD